MAVDKIVISVEGNAQGVKPVIDDLEKLGAVDKKNAEQFKKTNDEFKKAAAERKKRIDEETQDLAELQQAKKKAFSVEEIQKYNDRIAETKKRISTLKDETEKSTSFMGSQFRQLGAQIAGAFAVTQLVAFGKEAVLLAAKAEGITLAFGRLNQPDLLANLRTATRGTITDLSLMTAAVKAQNFKLPLENLATFFKFAQQRARETGESVDYLVESIVTGIGRKSPLILDNLGISAVELRKALKGVGVETADVGDIASAVGVIIDRELAKQGNLALTTADKIDQMAVRWNNVKIGTGKALIAALDYFGKTKEGIEDVDALLKARLFRGFSAQLNEGIGEFEDAMSNWAAAQNKSKEPQKEQIRNVAFLKQLIEDLSKELLLEGNSVEQNKSTVKQLTAAQDELNAILGKTTNSIKEQKKELDKPHKGIEGVEVDIKDYELKQKEIADLAQAGKDEETRIREEALKKQLALDDLLAENEKKNQEEVTANLEKELQLRQELEQIYIQGVEQLAGELFNIISQSEKTQTNAFIANLDYKLKAGKISDEQYTQQRKVFLKKQAEDERELAIFQSVVKAALAVINAITTGDPYTAAARAAVAAAIGAAEVIAISSAPLPQFEKGGRIKGKRHKDGGTIIEAEKDEFVISRKAAQKIGFDNLELLNKGIVPVKLLRQGISDSREKRMENTLKAVFGSNDFDTYNIEKLLKKGIQNDKQVAQYLVRELRGDTRKRGGLK